MGELLYVFLTPLGHGARSQSLLPLDLQQKESILLITNYIVTLDLNDIYNYTLVRYSVEHVSTCYVVELFFY